MKNWVSYKTRLELEEILANHLKYENDTFAYLFKRYPFTQAQFTYGFLKPMKYDLFPEYKLNPSLLRFMEDDYRIAPVPWHMPRVGAIIFFYQHLEKFILEAHQHGIVEHFRRKWTPRSLEPDPSEPKVLTMYMLSAGFILWLGSVAVACIVFIFEHIVRYNSKRRRDARRNRRQLHQLPIGYYIEINE